MATSKLLKPTNVTISIPEFTDQPDQRVNSNGLDKEADAINALSEHLGNLSSLTTTAKTSAVAAINELGYTKASAAEAKRVYQSTVGFADAIGISTSTSMAAAWDAKIRDKINTFTDNQTVPFTFNNGGPYFFGILGKLNNNYYSGLLWSYHDSCQITTWQFTNLNGTYYFRPLAERMGAYPT